MNGIWETAQPQRAEQGQIGAHGALFPGQARRWDAGTQCRVLRQPLRFRDIAACAHSLDRMCCGFFPRYKCEGGAAEGRGPCAPKRLSLKNSRRVLGQSAWAAWADAWCTGSAMLMHEWRFFFWYRAPTPVVDTQDQEELRLHRRE